MIKKIAQTKKGVELMILGIVIGVIVLIIVIWLISSETLEKVVAARNQAMTATNIDDKIKQENVLSGALKSLFAVSESYPELKANENFNKLQDQLQRLEEEIAGSRRYYNGVVNRYNTKTELFPGNIIAGIFGFKRKPLFEVSNESERENVQVKF